MSQQSQPLRAKHRGSIRTKLRILYLVAAFKAAQADPALAIHVALLGNLFSRRRGQAVISHQLVNALAARHPDTGQPLRARVNAGTRSEGDRRVSNVCHGFDIPLAVDKSVSVAALVFEDKFILNASMTAMRQAARWLGKRMDRRLRKDGQNATVSTGTSAMFFLPEKAGRHGQPQLHAHVLLPNLTTFREGGRKRYCAGHFKRITKLAATAQRRMNAQLARTLSKKGYQVDLVHGVCRLPSVPQGLCARFSPVSAMLKEPATSEGAPRRRSTKLAVRRREDSYLKIRPDKVLMTLQEHQARWAQEVGVELLKAEKKNYRAARFQKPPKSMEIRNAPADIPLAPALPVAAYRQPPVDEALDDHRPAVPEFRSVGIALRARLQRELTAETRAQAADLDHFCPETQPDLEQHTEALRTLLRLIFPRLMVHQKYTASKDPSFVVSGAVASNPEFSRIVAATAAALDAELGQAHVRANWASVLRWLHTELSLQAPEPVRPVVRICRAPKIEPVQEPKQAVAPASPIAAPIPATQTLPPSVPTAEPEMEMLP